MRDARGGKMLIMFLTAAIGISMGCDEEEEYDKIIVESPAFGEGETIPARHTCDGDELSPPLSFLGAPEETESYVVIMEDPDSPLPPTIHWLIWGISASSNFLSEDQNGKSSAGVLQGTNSAGELGYFGPCPPTTDRSHHYQFKVYALDANIDLKEGASKSQLAAAMKGHIVARGELTGLYDK